MSAADAGRGKIEDREAELIAVGDDVLSPNGQDFRVTGLGDSTSTHVSLMLQPKGQCGSRPLWFKRHESIRVRRTTKEVPNG